MEQIASGSDSNDDDSDSESSATVDDESSSSSDYHYHTATNGFRRITSTEPLHLKDALKYPVIEILKAEVVGNGIAYLSAESCSVRGTLGSPPDENHPCVTGVVDSGGALQRTRFHLISQFGNHPSTLNLKESVETQQGPLDTLSFLVIFLTWQR